MKAMISKNENIDAPMARPSHPPTLAVKEMKL
jgi:hypothetical protein